MKKLLILLFSLFFLSSPSVFAENFIYHCNLDTYYKNSEAESWQNKYIRFTFTANNNNISIYDHEYNFTYPDKNLIIYSENPQLVAIYQDSSQFSSLVIDKPNNFGTYTISYSNGNFAGQFGMGRCYLQ